MFDLKRPCKTCPFKKGNGENFALCQARIEEIIEAPAFQCHSTIDYGRSVDENGEFSSDCIQSKKGGPQQCVGLMTLLHREGVPNTIMQVGERLKAFDPEQLDPDGECYETIDEAMEAHVHGRRSKNRRRKEC